MVCLILYACADHLEEEGGAKEPVEYSAELEFGKNRELTKSFIKEWYAGRQEAVSRLITSDQNDGVLIMPSWNHVKEWKKDKYEVVEASLLVQTSVMFFDEETLKKADFRRDAKKMKNVGRMIFLKDLETGTIRNFVMIVIGSYNYLMKDDNHLSDNIYLRRDPDFSGMIVFYEPDGKLINGWKYEDGKIVYQIKPVNGEEKNEVATRAASGIRPEGYTPIFYLYDAAPKTRYYWGGELGEVTIWGNSDSEGGGGSGGGSSDWSWGSDQNPIDLEDVDVWGNDVGKNDSSSNDDGYVGGGGGGATNKTPEKRKDCGESKADTRSNNAAIITSKAGTPYSNFKSYTSRANEYSTNINYHGGSSYVMSAIEMGGANGATSNIQTNTLYAMHTHTLNNEPPSPTDFDVVSLLVIIVFMKLK